MYSWEQKLTNGSNDLRYIPAFGQEPGPMEAAGLEEHTVNLRMRPVRKRVRNQQLFAAGLIAMGLILPFALDASGLDLELVLISLVRAVFFGSAVLLLIYSRRNTDPLGLRDKKEHVLADQAQVSRRVFGSPWGFEDDGGRNKRKPKKRSIEGTKEDQFTFAGLEKLSQIPGVKIFYGKLFSGKSYSGNVHMVMCGHKVALVETLPYPRPFSPQERTGAAERLNQLQSLLSDEWNQGVAGRTPPEVRGIIVSYDEKEQHGHSISSAIELLGTWFTSDDEVMRSVDRQLLAYLIALNR